MKDQKELRIDAEAIRYYLRDRGMSYAELADKANVTTKSLEANLEWGYMLEGMAERVAKALGVDVIEIMATSDRKIQALKDELYKTLVDAYDIQREIIECYNVRSRQAEKLADAIFEMTEDLVTEDDE